MESQITCLLAENTKFYSENVGGFLLREKFQWRQRRRTDADFGDDLGRGRLGLTGHDFWGGRRRVVAWLRQGRGLVGSLVNFLAAARNR
jgi:hypothetical protein